MVYGCGKKSKACNQIMSFIFQMYVKTYGVLNDNQEAEA